MKKLFWLGILAVSLFCSFGKVVASEDPLMDKLIGIYFERIRKTELFSDDVIEYRKAMLSEKMEEIKRQFLLLLERRRQNREIKSEGAVTRSMSSSPEYFFGNLKKSINKKRKEFTRIVTRSSQQNQDAIDDVYLDLLSFDEIEFTPEEIQPFTCLLNITPIAVISPRYWGGGLCGEVILVQNLAGNFCVKRFVGFSSGLSGYTRPWNPCEATVFCNVYDGRDNDQLAESCYVEAWKG